MGTYLSRIKPVSEIFLFGKVRLQVKKEILEVNKNGTRCKRFQPVTKFGSHVKKQLRM